MEEIVRYLSESYLKQAAGRFASSAERKSMIQSHAKAASVTIFLSHSHLDRELVKGFIQILAEKRVSVYVDWNDSSMPK
jgi:hypothetical protein